MNNSYIILLCFVLCLCTYDKVEHDSDNDNIKIRELNDKDGYVVGFDPCTIRHNYYNKGYVIITTDNKDTLLTYNFPDTIFNFPSEYFANYMNSGYFPEIARYEFNVHLAFYIANENEKIFLLCAHDFNQSEFSHATQVIIKTAVKY